MSEDQGSSPRPRPKLTPPPPPRANLESLFRGGAGAGLSPGPMTLASSFFTENPGSDSGLLDSPAFFSSGRFGMSHQEALAQATAQAVQFHSNVQPHDYLSSLSATTTAPLTQPPVQGMLPVTSDTTRVDNPADDGYNWRKYGEMQVQGSEFPRSYYKCTHPSCLVKKKVEPSREGRVMKIYRGEHNHPRPISVRRKGRFGMSLEKALAQGAGAGLSPGLMTPISSFFAEDPGSDSGLLDSPAFFSSGRFGMSNQEALAQATAQAVQFHSNVQPHDYLSSRSATTTAPLTQPPVQGMLPVTSDTTRVDKPADDGYNWRKYGQKQVKGSEFIRSYYECTHPSCPVKKMVEHSLEGRIMEIICRGKHNHPPPNKRAKEGGVLPAGSNDINENLDFHANSEKASQSHLARSNDVHVSASKRGRESSYGTAEHISGSSHGEELVEAAVRTDEADTNESDMKRTRTESRIILQVTSEVDLLDDGYRWRKYGQKMVKGNPNPRSYYRCTYAGCNVRKHVERASTDPKDVLTTYEGRHNHGVPAARNSSHNTANAANIMHPKAQSQAYLNRRDFR